MMPDLLSSRPSVPAQAKTYQAATVTECLLLARRDLGPDAEIVGQRKVRKGAWFGRWGGKEVVEVTCRLTPVAPSAPHFGGTKLGRPLSAPSELGAEGASSSQLQALEARLADLTRSVQGLVDAAQKQPFQAAPVLAVHEDGKKDGREKRRGGGEAAGEPYPALLQQLLDAEVAPPLARQLIAELPPGLPAAAALDALRTLLSQRLRLAPASDALPGVGHPRLLAFVGTTGVGKTTTLAKLAARYALVEGKSVGIVTLDTHRVAAAQQLQTLGDVLGVPVRVAHDGLELRRHVTAYADEGRDWVLMDTAGRSPNDMLPLGETAALFQGLGPLQTLLAAPATLSARDLENSITRFQSFLSPDALILTKLDEATDNACFGRLLTVQAKHGLPLAYVTTGPKVPDDIAVPDSHVIAARIVSTALL